MRERGPQRTYGIWGFVAVFVALATVGLVALIMVGSGSGGTEQLSPPQSLPEGWDDIAAGASTDQDGGEGESLDPSDGEAAADGDAATQGSTTDGSTTDGVGGVSSPGAGQVGPGGSGVDASGDGASSPGSATRVTLPDGRPAPEGVAEVLVDGELTSYVLTPPPTVANPSRMEPVVAPMGLAQFDGGSEVRLTIGCARSSQEFLAQVAVTEAADTITFVAIALAPSDGPPCVPGATPIEMWLPLRTPVGGRTVVVVPPDSPVPGLAPA